MALIIDLDYRSYETVKAFILYNINISNNLKALF